MKRVVPKIVALLDTVHNGKAVHNMDPMTALDLSCNPVL